MSRGRPGEAVSARRDLLLVVLILIVVDAVVATFLIYAYYPARRDEALEKVPTQLALLARDRQNAVSGWVSERLADAELAAHLLSAGDPAAASALIDYHIRLNLYEWAVVIDDSGRITRGWGRHQDADVATVRRFARRPHSSSRRWIDFARAPGHQPEILTAARLISGQSAERTIVFGSDPYDYVYPLFTTVFDASRTGETNLIGLDGVWAIGLTPYRDATPPPMSTRTRVSGNEAAQALARGEQGIQMIDRLGHPVIGVVKAIPQTPWVVFAKIDVAEVAEEAVDESRRLGQVIAFGSLMLAITAFAVLRSRRVHAMRSARDHLVQLYENTSVGILVMRVLFDDSGEPTDHQVVEMNPAAARFFGVSAAEEIGKRSGEARYLQWPSDLREQNYAVALFGNSLQYERYDPESKRWYETQSFCPIWGQIAHLLTDVTERRASADALRRLSTRVLRVQDQTQRRIARELHDSVSQSLGGLRMNLTRLQSSVDEDSLGTILEESLGIVDDAIAEVRTISYLLHPPMIEQAGLVSALRWYADGFQHRSGVTTTLDVPNDLVRLTRDRESAVFRIVQEGLTNVQRHSGSATARVTVQPQGDSLTITIADDGRGLPAELRDDRTALLGAGVGIAGMNERVHELNGEMNIVSSESGTILKVTLPIETKPETAEA
jgi:signal transduction histidine kinase